METHGFAKNIKEATKIAVNAGSDMDMESYAYVYELSTLVKKGLIKEELINDAVRRILKVKFELGLFDDPYKYLDEEREKIVTGNKEIQDAVLDIALKSIVLLKNENELLPLKKENQKIALIGALASDKTSPLGSWRLAAEDKSATSVLEGMQYYSKNKLIYSKGADLTTGQTSFINELNINKSDKSEFQHAIQTAKKADVVVMVIGEHGFQSGEGRSRTDLDLPGVQQELLEAVFKVNKNIVLVLNNGRPLTITWADENIPAIVEAWQLGTRSGEAIAKVLYGDYNPSGKLPVTFPRKVGQVPIYYNYKNTGRPKIKSPNQVFWSHYIDESNLPLYPFGYGLSYTKFSYKNISVTKEAKESVKVSVKVKNTGKVVGKEVVQLYIRDLYGSITRPVKELKGFKIISLKPNQETQIDFYLTKKELGFFNNNGEFILESGEFKVFVGGSSKADLQAKFKI